MSNGNHFPKIALGAFAKNYLREEVILSTKFTPQIAIAWAIAKGNRPIIGVTRTSQVTDAAKAASIRLTTEEMTWLETLAKEANVDTRGFWGNPMA